MSESDIIEGEVIDASPAPTPGTSMVAAANPYMSMAQTVISTGRGIEQLERLLDLQLRWDAEQARRAFFAAMAEFKKQPLTVSKDRENKQYDSRYTSLGNLVGTVSEAMAPFGLTADWEIDQGDQIEVTCVLSHSAGHSKRVKLQGPPDDSGKKNDLQKVKSTLTYLRGATFEAVTGVASSDSVGVNLSDDGNGTSNSNEAISPEQVKVLQDLIDAYVSNAGKFMDWIRGAADMKHVKELADIPASRFQFIHDQLGRIRAQKIQENGNG